MTDGDSVTINNLRDSENGTFVTLDDYLSLTVLSGLENSKSEAISDIQESAQTCTTDISWKVGIVTNGPMAGVMMNGMMIGVLLDGTKVGNKRKTLPKAHFHLEDWISVPPAVRSGLIG